MTYEEHLGFLERHVEAMQELTERTRAEAELAGFVLGGCVSAEATPPTLYQDEHEQARFEMGFSDGRWLNTQQPQQS